MTKKILIIEDESLIAHSIKLHLDQHDYVCDIALNPKIARILIRKNKYAGLICDINLKSEINGIEFVDRYVDNHTPVVFLTAYADLETMQKAAALSPLAYVTKPFDKNHLLVTLNLALVNSQKKFLHHLSENIHSEEIELTDREIDIVRLLAQSKTTDEIAEELFISPMTVSTHRKNILRKTGVKGIVELVSLAVEKGWV